MDYINVYDITPAAPSTHTVTYNCNGGTTGCPTSPISASGSITLPAAPSQSGYDFTGWECSADSKIYNASASYSVSTDVTFTAQWKASSSCTAPTSVSVGPTSEDGNYGYRYSIGETIKLTATATGGSGTYSYQWQKYIGSSWTDITDKTDEGISGTQTTNLVISNCTSHNGGSYRCKVSTGNECVTESAGYQIYIFTLNGAYNESTSGDTEYAIQWTDEKTGVATIHLNANSWFDFKVTDNDGKWYGSGNGNYIIKSGDSKDCGTENAKIRLFTGPEGDYKFNIDITHSHENSPYVKINTTYPEVEHPAAGYAYFEKPSEWKNVYLYWYTGDDYRLTDWNGAPEVTSTATICNKTYYYAPVGSVFSNVIWKGDGTNQWTAISTSNCSGKYLDKTYYNNPAWMSFATYSITFNGNGSTDGEMTNVTGICPGSSVPLAANAYTKTGYTFSKWKDADDNEYNDEATISNIQKNYALTAQWAPNTNTSYTVKHYQQKLDDTYPSEPTETEDLTGTTDASVTPNTKSYTGFTAPSTQTLTIAANGTTVVTYNYERESYTLTWNLDGGSIKIAGTAAGSVKFGASLTAPTVEKTGYTFTGWNPEVPATMPANAATHTAQWTAKTYTITFKKNGGSADGSATATYNSSSLTDVSHATNSETYTLVGYYTENDTKVINADGTLVVSVPNYTDANGKWIKDNDCTLYAHWQQNLITPTVTWGTNNPATVYPGGKYTISVSTNSDATLAVGNLTASKATLEDQVVSGSTITATMTIDANETNAPSLHFHADATSTYSASDETQNITLGSCSGGEIGEETTYTCGFESADGWSATSISSNSTQLTESPTFSGGKTGKQWTVSVSINTGSASGTKGATVAIANTQVASGSYSLYGSAIGSQNPDYWEMVSDFTFNDISAISYKQYDNDKGKTATKVYYSTDKTNWTQFGGDITSTANQWTDIAVTCTDVSNKKDIYLKIRGENTGTSSGKIVAIDDLSITYKSSSSSTGGEKQTPTLTWNDNTINGGSISKTDLKADETFLMAATASSIGTVSYSSKSESVATIGTDGTVTIKGNGQAILTAKVAEVGCFVEKSITCTLTVTIPVPTHTVTIEKNEDWGTVNESSVSVADGTNIYIDETDNKILHIGTTDVTATPKENTAQYSYGFANWSWTESLETVTKDITATATFTRTLNKYKVSYYDGDSKLGEEDVDYNGNPADYASYQTKQGYTFNGWYSDAALQNSVTIASEVITSAKSYYGKWTATTVSVTGVTLNKSELSLTVGNTETLTATIAPENATNKNVTWSSDKEGVATVEDGVVTAVAAGTATITVTTEDGSKTATCTVIVTSAGKQYATSVDFAAIAKEVKIDKTSTVAVSSVLNDNHYNISSTSKAEWDYQTSDNTGEKKADRGLKIKEASVTIDFWVQANKNVTMTFGTLAGTANGTISISTNGCSDSDYQDFTGAATASYGDPVSKIVETTEETHFCIKTKSSSWNIIKAITIEDATPTCTAPDLAYTTTSIEKQVGDASFTNSLTNEHGVSVTYTSSDTQVATVATDGTITLGTKVGSTTIKATSAAQTISEVDYCADEASYTINLAAAPVPTYAITLNPHGGTISESDWTLSDDGNYIKSGIPSGTEVTLPTRNRDDYDFVKWTNNIGGEEVTSVTVTGDLTLHANWHETCQGGGSGGEYATATMKGLSEATYTGCSVEINNTNATHTIGTDCYVTFKGTLQSSKNYVKLTLNNERTFAAGDVVTIVYSQTQNGDNNQICVGSDDGDDQYEHPFEVAAQNTSKTGIYTIIENDGICGTSIIKVGRYGGSNGSFHSISISSGSSSGGGTCHYVTYHANAEDATGYTADETAYHDGEDTKTVTIKPCGYTREGYIFAGWATSSEGAVVYTAGATHTFTFDEDEDDLDLYAQWNKGFEVQANETISLTDPVDVLIIHQGGQVTGDVTVNERIEYIRPTVGKYSAINQWYTFSVPFAPTDVTIYDETDKKAYPIDAVWEKGSTLQAGYYYLKTLFAQTVAKDVVASWKYITSAKPEKDKPYIIYFSNEHGFGNYFETNTQVSFIAEAKNNNSIEIDNDATPDVKNIDGFQLVANPTLHNIEVQNVYVLNPATHQFELEENAIIPPFECFIQATKEYTAANAIIRFIPEGSFIYTDWKGAGATQSDKPCKFIENERLMIRYNGQLYDGTGAMLNRVK
ncbi:MAG: InlB B-repeat-containing protein [Paludibacteraceae bacterium]|nr:InlB B-repeat-containing protein [Paludibacteraceae bacterium]